MTGFARSESNGEFGSLVWELRSVNHRYLEIHPRLPEDLRALEQLLRERVQTVLARGKLDVSLRWRRADAVDQPVEVNEAMARKLIATVGEVEHWMHNAARFSAMEILRWPGVVRNPEQELQPVLAAALACLDEALAGLREHRAREGEHIGELLLERCRGIIEQVAIVRARRPQVLETMRDRWRTRIQEMGVEADPGRLEQELALQAQRLDVAEELDRMEGHVKEIKAVLQRREPVGRRLDFLMQELNREANTLSSKSNDMETTQAAVELKVLIEQMREQVQNIE